MLSLDAIDAPPEQQDRNAHQLCRLARLDCGDVFGGFLSCCFKIVARLQAEPKLGRGSQIARESAGPCPA